jgi:cell division protein FtsZ
MGRRKRASMREGPLADLFRSTIDDPPADPPEAPVPGSGHKEEREPAERPPEPPHEPPAAIPPEPEEVHAYRAEAPSPTSPPPVPAPRERLNRIFADDPREAYETPRYGREEPAPRLDEDGVNTPIIRVVGVGGAGVNAVNRMVETQIPGVEFMAVNTDLQSLQLCIADVTVHIGGDLTRGLGSGSDPDLGYRAAFNEQDKIKRLLKGSDMVFVAAGAGGGTGTGAAPVVARLAREVGALTVGIITRPFSFEGTRRGSQASKGIDVLAAEVDTLITVPNDRLLSVLDQDTSMVEAFRVADDVLRQGVQGISDLVTLPALINLDFADVHTIMSEAGQALLGIGMGMGEQRALLAAQKAISSPLLETSVEGARAILLSITGGTDLSLVEVSEAAKVIQEAAHPDANIIFGANVDEHLTEQVWVTVVATRFDGRARSPRRDEEAPAGRRAGARTVQRASELGGVDVPEFVPGA